MPLVLLVPQAPQGLQGPLDLPVLQAPQGLLEPQGQRALPEPQDQPVYPSQVQLAQLALPESLTLWQ